MSDILTQDERVANMTQDSLFGVHGAALTIRAQRLAVLASNIANAATPGYKARDIDFSQALAAAESGRNRADAIAEATLYRTPSSASLDGNTVEISTEQTMFAENALQYRTTLAFIDARINGLRRALKGE